MIKVSKPQPKPKQKNKKVSDDSKAKQNVKEDLFKLKENKRYNKM